MKIDPTTINAAVVTPSSTGLAGTARTGANRAVSATAPDSAEGKSTDQVQISNLLESLQRAASLDEEISPERAAYLDKLAAAVESGDYEVDAKELSSRIVEDTLRGIG